jgi:hypothetical protein
MTSLCLENATLLVHKRQRGRRGLDRMIVGFTPTIVKEIDVLNDSVFTVKRW